MGLDLNKTMSVVIPVRNRAGLIGRCLDSVKAQTWRPINVIVVDNGSTDDTRHTVMNWIAGNEDENFRLTLVDESQPGAAVARNRGLREVDTEFVLFFDSDDKMNPELIENAIKGFQHDTEADVVHWKSRFIHSDGKVKKRKFNVSNYWPYHIYHALFSTQCFAVRTDYFRRIGAWSETLLVWDDWELGVRLLLGNPKMAGIDKVLAEIYPQKESITGENFYSKAGEWERAIDVAEQDVAQSGRKDADRLIDMINYRRAILAAHYKREKRPDLAEPLLKKALEHRTLSLPRKRLLWLLYQYTASGGRGAYMFWR